jgi:hypothetical protein
MADKYWLQTARDEMERKGTTGSFTAQAKRAGMTVREFAHKSLAAGSRAATRTKKRAQFALNAIGSIARAHKGND